MTPLKTVLTASLTALALAACGSGGDSAGDTGDADGTAAADAGGTSVSIVDNAFEPTTLEAGTGDTVTWTNDGGAAHTVTFDDEDSGNLEPGATYERTFEESGEYDYVCTIHAGMEGTVSVSG